jgi:hypothetical protein
MELTRWRSWLISGLPERTHLLVVDRFEVAARDFAAPAAGAAY